MNVREALRLLKERDETKLRELREMIQVGIDRPLEVPHPWSIVFPKAAD
jgi:Arc/MetJ-type ribon-helix-helix transcriptional regulator